MRSCACFPCGNWTPMGIVYLQDKLSLTLCSMTISSYVLFISPPIYIGIPPEMPADDLSWHTPQAQIPFWGDQECCILPGILRVWKINKSADWIRVQKFILIQTSLSCWSFGECLGSFLWVLTLKLETSWKVWNTYSEFWDSCKQKLNPLCLTFTILTLGEMDDMDTWVCVSMKNGC